MNGAGLFEQFVSTAQSAAANLRIRSALNPMLWLCGIISLPCFIGSYLFRGTEPLASVLMYVGVAPVGATILGFFYFMIASPDKLQSEEYQLRHETLELIKEKGSSVEILPSSLDAIPNTIKALPRGGEG
jgi:hypothetical protein